MNLDKSIAANGDVVVNGVDQSLLQKCMSSQTTASNCAKTVPGLAHCEAMDEVCNQQFVDQVRSQFPSSPATSGAHLAGNGLITRSQAEQAAWSGLTSLLVPFLRLHNKNASATLPSYPIYSQLMSYRSASNLFGEVGNASVDPNTPVWMVTIDAPIPAEVGLHALGVPSKPKFGVTTVSDAVNGNTIDSCLGCTTLKVSK